jgi:mRNA interferase RelE/StbE
MFEVILSPEAKQFYETADAPLAKKLMRCFGQLEQEPRRHNNIKRLTGSFSGLLRFRIGDWRVVYRIEDHVKRVLVLSIANRREVYD